MPASLVTLLGMARLIISPIPGGTQNAALPPAPPSQGLTQSLAQGRESHLLSTWLGMRPPLRPTA